MIRTVIVERHGEVIGRYCIDLDAATVEAIGMPRSPETYVTVAKARLEEVGLTGDAIVGASFTIMR